MLLFSCGQNVQPKPRLRANLAKTRQIAVSYPLACGIQKPMPQSGGSIPPLWGMGAYAE